MLAAAWLVGPATDAMFWLAICYALVGLQHVLATFRSARVSTMSCELNEQQASLKVTVRCENGEHHHGQPPGSCSAGLLGMQPC